MALIVSDIDGDVERLHEFLDYKPEEEHIVLGDVFDGTATDEEMIACFDLILHGNARHPELFNFVWGNHEIGHMYLAPFVCSGQRLSPVLTSKINRCKYRFDVALVRDGYLLTHAGVHPKLAKFDDINEQCEWLNSEWRKFRDFVAGPYTTAAPSQAIFNCGEVRGGSAPFGGIFWLDWRREEVSDKYNQVFGHCAGTQIHDMEHHGRNIVCVDTITNECFNTKTGQVEQYGFNR